MTKTTPASTTDRVCAVVVTAVLGVLGPILAAAAANAAPTFYLPFPSGASYKITASPSSPNHSTGQFVDYNRHAVDFGMKSGSTVTASAAGSVFFAGHKDQYSGNAVWIDHGGNQCTQYVHLSGISVNKGAQVASGQQIGRSGTGQGGDHLHWAMVYCSGANAGKTIQVIPTVERGTNYSVNETATSRNGAAVPAPPPAPPAPSGQHLKEPLSAGCTADGVTIATRPFSGMTLQLRYSAKCGTNWLRIENMRGPVRFYVKSDAYPQEVSSDQNGTGGTHWSNQVHAPGKTCVTIEAKSLSSNQGTGRQRIC